MAHYEIELDESRRVASILRDGRRKRDSVKLEQVFSVASFYFRAAHSNLIRLREAEDEIEREVFGLQSFLLVLTGVEAFINSYFLLRAKEQQNAQLEDAINRRDSKLHERLTRFIELSGDGQLQDKQRITDKLSKFSAFRNELVHPRWEESSVALNQVPLIRVNGLVENPRTPLMAFGFCDEVYWWCVYAIALVGELRNATVDGFVFHWTGEYGFTLDAIRKKLHIS